MKSCLYIVTKSDACIRVTYTHTNSNAIKYAGKHNNCKIDAELQV